MVHTSLCRTHVETMPQELGGLHTHTRKQSRRVAAPIIIIIIVRLTLISKSNVNPHHRASALTSGVARSRERVLVGLLRVQLLAGPLGRKTEICLEEHEGPTGIVWLFTPLAYRSLAALQICGAGVGVDVGC
jgi:hypothetical protein